MSGQIRITHGEMRGRAGEVRQQRDTFEDVINRMQGLIDALQGEWEGQASAAYAEQWANLRPSFNQAKEVMGDLAQQLDGTAAAMEDMDQQIASKFR